MRNANTETMHSIKGLTFLNFNNCNIDAERVYFVEPEFPGLHAEPELSGADSVTLGHGRPKSRSCLSARVECGTIAPSRQSTAGRYSEGSSLTISACVTLTHAFGNFVDERCHGRTSENKQKETRDGGSEKRKQPLRRTRVRGFPSQKNKKQKNTRL